MPRQRQPHEAVAGLGVSAADIARLFLVSKPTMAARLTRARKHLAGERFDVPAGPELEQRIGVAADVAYLAFTAAYAPASGHDVHRPALADEAIRLARVVREVAPPNNELDALLALMLLQHSRRDARIGDRGEPVMLADQDRSRWHRAEIDEAIGLLTPLTSAPPAPYLLQALVAAEHAITLSAADTAWSRICRHYAELEQLTGSAVVRLNRAVAVAEADGPLAGLRLLEGLDLPGHRLPGVRGELLLRVGRYDAARAAFDLALSLCDNQPERRHLRGRRDSVPD